MEDKSTAIMVAPKGTVTIATDEYADLVASKALLEVIVASKEVGGYCTDNIIESICKAFPTPSPKGAPEDA